MEEHPSPTTKGFIMGKASTGCGKGSWKRPCKIGTEELELREKLAYGEMSLQEYSLAYTKLLKKGLITRDGKVIKSQTE